MSLTVPPPRRAWQVITAGICALVLTVGLARFAYTPLLPVMRLDAGLTAAAGGWLATFNYLGYLAGTVLVARVGDMQLKFRFYRIGLVLAVVSTGLMGTTTDMAFWGVLRFVAGLSSTAGLLLASGLVLNWLLAHQRRPQLGLHFAGLGVGIAVSGLAAAAMADQLASSRQWIALGTLAVVFLIPAWAWMPPPAAISSTTGANAPPPPGRRWRWLLIASYFCAGVGFVVSATFIVAILVQTPAFASHGSWVWMLVGLTAIPSTFAWDRLSNRLGLIRALMLAYALQATSFVLPLLDGGLWAGAASAVLFGLTFAGIVSLTLTVVGRHYPHNPAKAMATLTLSYGVAQIIAPAIAGTLARDSGSYQGALVLAAIMMVIGIVLLWCMPNDARSTPG
ncbi:MULTISPECIES: YbfB/YjiJ family MFS transporter [Stenotrophomonas]|jgi:predicted MFS family arabinose efflux permease|uniref:YbfB/YjiJ family MFS transporter n=1 Tax=Stenotrophomonas TaxID=40323 RepID=UPI00061AF948|nr:YbfB/YjiJ family MFS transporter [Stenotrophomonas sp. BIO128-Bstrain]WIA62326.1 YbfB/YjiJ family MFS transporter [Stenotrophomonas sp. BIO128-Bstrain]